MRYFGFGTTFIEYVKLLFQDSFCCVINNGFFSENINPTRATKQGCCTSPFLFNLVSELVAIKIRNNDRIKGITIRDIEYKIAQFADDLTMFLQFDKVTLMETSRLFDELESYTGLKVNYDKTSVYHIGSLRNSNARLYTGKPFVWTNEPIVILGGTITPDQNELQLLNFAPVFEKMQTICQVWQKRKLSLTGKVIIVNSLIGSMLVHKLTVLPCLQQMYVVEFEKLVKNFLWEGKRSKIAMETLYNSKECGGLALINIQKKDIAIKAQWANKCKFFKGVDNLAMY